MKEWHRTVLLLMIIALGLAVIAYLQHIHTVNF